MEILAKLISNKFSYYVQSIDGQLIESNTEHCPDEFTNLAGCDLANQPETDTIHRFYSDQNDSNYDFNPNMQVEYSFENGHILATDIYGQVHQLKFVMNLQLQHHVYENLCYRSY